MSKVNHFIGYGDLAKWAAAADKVRPVYAQPIVDPGRVDKMGLGVDTHVVLVQQFDEAGHVHYVRIVTGRETMFNGERMPGRNNVQPRTQSAWEIVQGWLLDNGFDVREAVVAAPRDLTLMNGHADEIMRYDKEADRFCVMAVTDALVEAGAE